jgi:hypothetical protein
MNSHRRTFVQKCLAGEAAFSDIDDFVDQWHESSTACPLHEFLGLTEAEYARWVERPEALRDLVLAHKERASIRKVSDAKSRTGVAPRLEPAKESKTIAKRLPEKRDTLR